MTLYLGSSLLLFLFAAVVLANPLPPDDAVKDGYIDKPVNLRDLGVTTPTQPTQQAADTSPGAGVQVGISESLVNTFRLYSEYCAAAYCDPQQGQPGGKVQCGKAGTCPNVEKLNTEIYGTWLGQAVDGAGATGYVAADHTNKNVVLSLRGSVSLANWVTDAKWFQTDCYDEFIKGAKCEIGFLEFWQQSRPSAMPAIQRAMADNPGYQLIATGHSLGAAGAVYAAIELRQMYGNVTLVNFGQPRAGNKELSQYVTSQGNNYRVTHTSDPVPKLPPELLGVYQHISPEYWISDGEGNDPSKYHVVQGLTSDQGNAGTGQLDFNIIAHIQYFQPNMYYCVLPLPLGLLGGAGTKRSIGSMGEVDVHPPPQDVDETLTLHLDVLEDSVNVL